MHMSKQTLAGAILTAFLASLTFVPAAQASGTKTKLDPNARILACYKEDKIPAKYSVQKILVKKAEQKYLRDAHYVYLVEYPAVYREEKTLIAAEHVVMREVDCKTKK